MKAKDILKTHAAQALGVDKTKISDSQILEAYRKIFYPGLERKIYEIAKPQSNGDIELATNLLNQWKFTVEQDGVKTMRDELRKIKESVRESSGQLK